MQNLHTRQQLLLHIDTLLNAKLAILKLLQQTTQIDNELKQLSTQSLCIIDRDINDTMELLAPPPTTIDVDDLINKI
ncbi:MAG: hypothetical protein WCJ62_12485 [Flavobacterium sp.]|jgi:hypothetical protein